MAAFLNVESGRLVRPMFITLQVEELRVAMLVSDATISNLADLLQHEGAPSLSRSRIHPVTSLCDFCPSATLSISSCISVRAAFGSLMSPC